MDLKEERMKVFGTIIIQSGRLGGSIVLLLLLVDDEDVFIV